MLLFSVCELLGIPFGWTTKWDTSHASPGGSFPTQLTGSVLSAERGTGAGAQMISGNVRFVSAK